MYCSACGVQNSDGATHCVNCGSHLTEAIPQGIPVEPPVMASPKTSGLAIASLVLGIFSLLCFPFAGIAAIICGIIALVKINTHQLKGTGFAIAGIVIPVIMVPFMLAILMPALSQVRHIAQRVVCGTNLKGLSTAMIVYMNDYDDMLPADHWCDLLIEKADVSPKSFICPDSDAIEGESSYAMNANLLGKHSGKIPPEAVLFFETDKGKGPGPRDTPITARRFNEFLNKHGMGCKPDILVYKGRFNQIGGPSDVLLRHNENGRPGCNIVFADGHTEFVTEDRIATLKWTAE